MLSVSEIFDRLNLEHANQSRLSIVPKPDEERARERGGTSVDLRLGRWFRSFKQSQSTHYELWAEPVGGNGREKVRAIGTKEHFVRFGSEFVLHPGRFVLGVTLEWLSLPVDLSGYVTGKSSLGRHGLVIETAAGIHPGFSGCLTLELANVGEVPLVLSPGMEICQIFLHKTKAPKERADTSTDVDPKANARNPGTFSGRRKPAIDLPKVDATFEKLKGPMRSDKDEAT
ncbi:MAG TPA: dCTP deaminase [Allosphingosinicella sp.]